VLSEAPLVEARLDLRHPLRLEAQRRPRLVLLLIHRLLDLELNRNNPLPVALEVLLVVLVHRRLDLQAGALVRNRRLPHLEERIQRE
jgi:hypothetical protein